MNQKDEQAQGSELSGGLGAFSLTEDDLYLKELAQEYLRRTEEYDRSVCTGPINDGAIMPVTSKEMALVSRNATAIRKEMEDRALRERGISWSRVARAICKASA